MKKYMRYLAPVLISAIFILAVYLLYHKLKAYSLEQIKASIEHIPHIRLILSFLLAVVNYFILIGYDWLALKAIHKDLPLPKVSLVSFVGQAVSYNFGALLGGTSVRFRFYTVWGFTIHEVLHLILMLAVTFWIGALGLSGLVFIIAPPVFPPSLLEKMPLHDVRLLGVILAGIAAAYMVLCFTVRKTVRVFGKEFVFPSPTIAVAQLFVSWIDLICAAACMWVLLPSNIGVGFLDFLPGYLMAQVAVVLTHIPGGVGVFELVIIHLTQTPHEQVVFAAVLMFRLIYYILPLLLAALILALYEIRERQNFFHDLRRWLGVHGATLLSKMVVVIGVLFLFFSLLSLQLGSSLGLTLSPSLYSIAGLTCSFAGAVLIFLAYGLQRRQAKIWYAVVLALVIAIVSSCLIGHGWIILVLAVAVLVWLLLTSKRFYRRSVFLSESMPGRWLVLAYGLLCLSLVLGLALLYTTFSLPIAYSVEQVFLSSIAIGAVLVVAFPTQIALRYRAEKEQKRLTYR